MASSARFTTVLVVSMLVLCYNVHIAMADVKCHVGSNSAQAVETQCSDTDLCAIGGAADLDTGKTADGFLCGNKLPEGLECPPEGHLELGYVEGTAILYVVGCCKGDKCNAPDGKIAQDYYKAVPGLVADAIKNEKEKEEKGKKDNDNGAVHASASHFALVSVALLVATLRAIY